MSTQLHKSYTKKPKQQEPRLLVSARFFSGCHKGRQANLSSDLVEDRTNLGGVRDVVRGIGYAPLWGGGQLVVGSEISAALNENSRRGK